VLLLLGHAVGGGGREKGGAGGEPHRGVPNDGVAAAQIEGAEGERERRGGSVGVGREGRRERER